MKHSTNKSNRRMARLLAATFASLIPSAAATAQVAVKADMLYTMAGPPIENGVVVITDGKIAAVGAASLIDIPDDYRVLSAKIATPGLVDPHGTVGLTGILNSDRHDQDQLERSSPMQPELRAIDAYNAHEDLIAWVRSFGVTTVHSGHAPGELISGQTLVAKTWGNTVSDAVLVETAMVAATLAQSAKKTGKGESPGTRGKMMAVLRQQLVKAREYRDKRERAEEEKKPSRDLSLETLVRVLEGDLPLLITVHRSQDIATALRLQEEFGFKLVLDGACEAYLLTDEIKKAGVPVIVHPTMTRAFRETANLTMENAARLKRAGIPIAIQSGYESYVPKVRVVLFEAAIAAANGLSFEEALASITIDAAKIIGVADRVGSLEVGKDGDVALYDGDPFEYTSHCTGVVIDGRVVSDAPR